MQTIRGRVALVIDEQQIAINLGAADGIAEGDKVQLLRAVDVPDPENEGASLGRAFVKKGSMIIDSVDEKFSVARVAKGRKGGSSQTIFAAVEPLFLITTNRSQDGGGRVFVQQADFVDVTLSDFDE